MRLESGCRVDKLREKMEPDWRYLRARFADVDALNVYTRELLLVAAAEQFRAMAAAHRLRRLEIFLEEETPDEREKAAARRLDEAASIAASNHGADFRRLWRKYIARGWELRELAELRELEPAERGELDATQEAVTAWAVLEARYYREAEAMKAYRVTLRKRERARAKAEKEKAAEAAAAGVGLQPYPDFTRLKGESK